MEKLTFTWKGKTVVAKLEITPGHQRINTYTVYANKTSAMFVFRKIEGVWQQAYGSEPEGLKDAIIKALDERFEA